MRGEIRPWHWVIAIAVAVLAQLALLSAVFSSQPPAKPAAPAGTVIRLTAISMPAGPGLSSAVPPDAPPSSLAPPQQTAQPAAEHKAPLKKQAAVALAAKTKVAAVAQEKQLQAAPNSVAKPTRPAQSSRAKSSPSVTTEPAATTPAEPKERVASNDSSQRKVERVESESQPIDSSSKNNSDQSVSPGGAPGPIAAAMPGTLASSKARYEGQLLDWIAQHKRYPRLARRQGIEGVVEVTFKLASDGRVETSQISASSGHAMLDQAVIDLLEQASPMPAPPEALGAESLNFRVPIAFTLR